MSSRRRRKSLNILFADNNSDFLKVRAEILREEGYRVFPADTPAAVRKLLKSKTKFTLAILDIRFIDDNNEEDKSGIRIAQDDCRDLPVLILTGYRQEDDIVREIFVRRSGKPTDYLSKREDIEVMLQRIRSLLSQAKAEQNEQTKKDFLFWAQFFAKVLGYLVILFGVVMAILGYTEVGVVSAIVGIIVQALIKIFPIVKEEKN